jgi:hypothetical protein
MTDALGGANANPAYMARGGGGRAVQRGDPLKRSASPQGWLSSGNAKVAPSPLRGYPGDWHSHASPCCLSFSPLSGFLMAAARPDPDPAFALIAEKLAADAAHGKAIDAEDEAESDDRCDPDA